MKYYAKTYTADPAIGLVTPGEYLTEEQKAKLGEERLASMTARGILCAEKDAPAAEEPAKPAKSEKKPAKAKEKAKAHDPVPAAEEEPADEDEADEEPTDEAEEEPADEDEAEEELPELDGAEAIAEEPEEKPAKPARKSGGRKAK